MLNALIDVIAFVAGLIGFVLLACIVVSFTLLLLKGGKG